MKRNRVLVVLVLLSIYVVTTQAFEVSDQPVVLDRNYDTWGDDSFITVASSTPLAISATSYTLDLTFSNSDSSTTRTVRVELLYSDGARVERTGESNSNPDTDALWLVATHVNLLIPPGDSTATTNLFTFTDAKLDAVVTGGGYFMVYTREESGTWTSGDYSNQEKRHDDIDVPDYTVWDGIFRPTAFLAPVGWLDGGLAYDTGVDYLTTAATLENKVDTGTIEFTTWTNTPQGIISQVDIHILLTLTGLSDDTITITVTNVNGPVGEFGPLTNLVGTTKFSLMAADGLWSYGDIASLKVNIVGTKNGGSDRNVAFAVYDIWCEVTLVP